jgi:hypothetical protein
MARDKHDIASIILLRITSRKVRGICDGGISMQISRNAETREKSQFTEQGLRGLRTGLLLAEKMGEGLG